ncbi:AAA family ATPase [Salipiger mangrovisoli]|uniref:Rad50/SbcC-type AAA domain-containing protein n=1 Tax=Salipiger mangrovisoli TaxID=2865933 RepID=A0ABR9X6V1_9RHOB|nr:AAA family ATPase [Salipiger mangrovisoli]MBE9639157.1 hypothetical protein [Salipiger mangrovisoli]
MCKFLSLKLICKESEELVEFGSRVSFFHGAMSSGKSTIVEMVNFCFGGKLVKTPAIASEVLKVQLTVDFSGNVVLFERGISSSSVDVSWNEEGGVRYDTLPLQAGSEPIIGDDIYNLSDFILNLFKLKPIKVRKRKGDDNSDLHRLSFRDFYRFCYLDQPELDSSLFHLEAPILGEKSKDVLKYSLGFQSDKLVSLQQQLQETRQKQRSLREAAEQVSIFLRKYGFDSESEIDQQVNRINSLEDSLEAERSKQKLGDVEVFLADELREQSRALEQAYADKLSALTDLDARINEQKSLQSELITLKMRAARASNATSILNSSGFVSCPSCGKAVEPPKDPHHCALCKSDLTDEDATGIQVSVIEQDLSDRIEDLKLSLRRLENSRRNQARSLDAIQQRRQSVAKEVLEVRKSKESEYLQRARKIESELGKLNERRRFLIKVREMPSDLEQRQKQADKLNAEISKLQRYIADEEGKFEQGRKNVRDLERNFIDILRAIHFPEVGEGDRAQVNTKTWMPYIYSKGREADPWTFEDVGSGGKMVLFKICYGLAIHKTAAENGLFMPKWFIVDSTMKNITPDINRDVFRNFYRELYRLLNNELSGWQCIIVDQTFSPFIGFNDGEAISRMLVAGDENNPPLISYYSGP